jgi:hypothetical protein
MAPGTPRRGQSPSKAIPGVPDSMTSTPLPRPPVIRPLSALTIGMWKSRQHESLYLIVKPEAHVFVFVVHLPESIANRQTREAPSPRGLHSPRLNSSLLRQIGASSPFSYDRHVNTGTVFGFEVAFGNVKGVNYANPLVRQGKITLEAVEVKKREFRNMAELSEHYEVQDRMCDCGESLGEKDIGVFAKRSLQFRNEDLDVREKELEGTENETGSFTFCVGDSDDLDDSSSRVVTNGSGDSRRVEGAQTMPMTMTEHAAETRGSHGLGDREGKGQSSAWSTFTLRRKRGIDYHKKHALPRLTIREKSSPDGSLGASPTVPRDAGKKPSSGGTVPGQSTKIYSYRTITAEFTDPHVPCVLAPVFKQDSHEQLLRMYESGLPTWAMFLPSYGMYYRPWVRSMTWVFFYLFSVFSLTLGFYDLYKTLPGLQDALAKLVESSQLSVWWPVKSVYLWIETHAQIRLSILLTYLFGKSDFFVVIVQRIVGRASLVMEPLWTLARLIMAPFRLVISLVSAGLLTSISLIIQPFTIAISLLSRVDMVRAGNSAASGVSWIRLSEAMRQSLVRAMRAANNVWKFVLNMCGGVSRHRMTLSRKCERNWMRFKDAIVGVFVHLYMMLVDMGGRGKGKEKEHDTASVCEGHSANHSLSFSNGFPCINEEEEVKSKESKKLD